MNALSKDVDVVVSGHTHQEYVCTVNGKLLTSTGFYGSALTSIDLTVAKSGVKSFKADNIAVINDTNKSLPAGLVALAKDATVDATVQNYVTKAAAVKNLPVGTITADIKRALLANVSTPTRDETAEGAMGGVMADFMYAGVPKADFAIQNPGGVRADLLFSTAGGVVTYGDLLTVAPYTNDLVTVDLTGAQIIRLLEQQWEAANCAAKTGANGCGRMLQPSAQLTYTWDASVASGAATGKGARLIVSSIKIKGVALDVNKTYRVATVSFLGQGGDNFTVMASGTNYTATGYKDIDAFVSYMKANPKLAPPAPRITRLN
jgi:5'-nucleotidase